MVVHPWAWGILALVAIGLVALDFLGHARNPHPPTAAEAARWTLFYVGLAAVFGVGIWLTNGWLYAQEFYAGWAMEWSLSVDNLFVFILILKAFRSRERTSRRRCSSASSSHCCCASCSFC